MRTLVLWSALILLAVPLASTQGVTFVVRPAIAPVGQPVTIILENGSLSTLYLYANMPPWGVYDSTQTRVHAARDLTVSMPIPPRMKLEWPWDQKDFNDRQVPAGRYEVRLYYYHAGGGSGLRAPLVIEDTAMTLSGSPTPGGEVVLALSAPAGAGLFYQVALSFRARPGILLPVNRELPLNPDWLFFLTVTTVTPHFQGFTGTLDSSGQGRAVLAIPGDPGLRGINVFAAFAVLDPGAPGGIRTFSNAECISIR